MIRIEGNGFKVEIPAGCENAQCLLSAVLAQLAGNAKPDGCGSAEGLISEEEAKRRERAAVEKARRKWKSGSKGTECSETRKPQEDHVRHENHEIVTRDENVITGQECMIECEDELININKNINKKTHSNSHSINTYGTQRSLAKVVSRPKSRSAELHELARNRHSAPVVSAGQYLLDFMYELPEEWRTEKVQQAWKVFVEEFTDFRHSSSRPKRQHTKEELLGILDILRFAYARQGEQGLIETIWQAVETQRRYVWDLPNSCRITHRQRTQSGPVYYQPEPEPEPEAMALEDEVEFQKEQVEFFRKLGNSELRKSAEKRLAELEGRLK